MNQNRMKNIPLVIFALGVICTLSLGGCTAAPAKQSEFLEGAYWMAESDRHPYHKGWMSETARLKRDRYNKVIVKPVNTSYLRNSEWFEMQTSAVQKQVLKDAKELASFYTDLLKKRIDQDTRLQVVDSPGPYTYVIEMAIIELVPSKAWWNAAATGTGFVVPGAGLLSHFGKGSIAIEGKFTDAQTGELFAMLADRKEDKVAPINLAGMTWYQGSKNNIKDWVDLFVEGANSGLDQKITAKKPFKLMPW